MTRLKPAPTRSQSQRCTNSFALASAPLSEPTIPYKLFAQTSFVTPEFADPDCLTDGTVGWLLRFYSGILFPGWLFKR